MQGETFLTRFGSTHSLFRSDTMQSLRSTNKKDEARDADDVNSRPSGVGRLRAISRVTWGSVARGLRSLAKDQAAAGLKSEFQQKLRVNSDVVVAILELAIVLLSCVQLELSSRSPRWRENRMCERLHDCDDFHDEGSFMVVDAVRLGIAALAIVRLWVRIRFLRNQCLVQSKQYPVTRLCVLELLALVLFPYPRLEKILSREQADLMVLLSVIVGVRTICWRQILYLPYPIRQKEKVASFSGNLEFSYREFVFKKVVDDRPLRKIITTCAILLTLTTFLVRAIETINGTCTLHAATDAATGESHHHVACRSLSWSDAVWLVATSFVMIGFGDIILTSTASRLAMVASSCVMRCVVAMLTSVIIKTFNFSSMEARVHTFLFRMDLLDKKDLTAVLALQATFRWTKSYKRSLMWHQHTRSQLYYRPLSARLPNEVKKKLYIARFQTSLKDILKFNTDGDPLNSFTKHIEVITAALGRSLIETAHLKRVYHRQTRILEERKRLMLAHAQLQGPEAVVIMAANNSDANTGSPQRKAPQSPPGMPRGSIHSVNEPPSQLASPDSSFSSLRPAGPNQPSVPPQFGASLLQKTNLVLAQLLEIEHRAKSFRHVDRRSSFVKNIPT